MRRYEARSSTPRVTAAAARKPLKSVDTMHGRDASAAEVRPRVPPVRKKGKLTRERIVQAAETVFVKGGYLDTRIADIAQEAGVAHGSFYTYFASKEEVFREVAERVTNEIYAALDAGASSDSPADRIRAANRRFLELYERHRGVLALIEQVATFDEFFLQMRRDLRQRFILRTEPAVRRILEHSETDLGLDPHVTANALGGMVDNFCYWWFVMDEKFDREAAVETLDRIWLSALGLDPNGA
jgi:AcrR family transcriptional regulator